MQSPLITVLWGFVLSVDSEVGPKTTIKDLFMTTDKPRDKEICMSYFSLQWYYPERTFSLHQHLSCAPGLLANSPAGIWLICCPDFSRASLAATSKTGLLAEHTQQLLSSWLFKCCKQISDLLVYNCLVTQFQTCCLVTEFQTHFYPV